MIAKRREALGQVLAHLGFAVARRVAAPMIAGKGATVAS